MRTAERRRWLALYVICLGDLMIVLDSNIVTVALPSIRADLGFSPTALAWVVNAYLLTFGGFLLLSGRLGDLFGNRRVLLLGVGAFTVASLACGLAPTAPWLVVGRAVQGLGAAVVSAVALSLITGLFSEPADRAKAMGVFGFVMSGGSALGVLLGGLLTGALSWHWVFLVNLPVGLAVIGLCLKVLPADLVATADRRLDVLGAVTVTASMMTLVYAVVGGDEAGWTSPRTLGLLTLSVALMGAFLAREARVAHPLVPLGLFRLRNLTIANAVGMLWAAAMFAWFFFTALYLQQVLGYPPIQVGLAFLPTSVVMAFCSLRLSDRLVMRFGVRPPLVAGLGCATAGLLLASRAPVDGGFGPDLLPSMLLLGLGAGIAFNPVLLAAMGDVEPRRSGLASGLVNTSFMLGGALGLAALAVLASWRTGGLVAEGESSVAALHGGYQVAFLAGALLAALAALGAMGAAPGGDACGGRGRGGHRVERLTSRRVVAVLPAQQRHEPVVPPPLDQGLATGQPPDAQHAARHRDHHHPVRPELVDEPAGQRPRLRGHQDAVVGCLVGPSEHPIDRLLDPGPGHVGRGDVLCAPRSQLRNELDAHHAASRPHEVGEDRGRPPRARSDVEHPVTRAHVEEQQHVAHGPRLRAGLASADQQRLVVVGVRDLRSGQEAFSRNEPHRLVDGVLAVPAHPSSVARLRRRVRAGSRDGTPARAPRVGGARVRRRHVDPGQGHRGFTPRTASSTGSSRWACGPACPPRSPAASSWTPPGRPSPSASR